MQHVKIGMYDGSLATFLFNLHHYLSLSLDTSQFCSGITLVSVQTLWIRRLIDSFAACISPFS